MTHSVTLERRGDVGLLRIDNPPVNALSPEVISGIGRVLDAFEHDRALRALLVYCAGTTFVAGADISFFDRADFTPADFNRFLQRLESSDRPVVAVLHGTALGGGLELALACHYRIALQSTRVGLPEVKLGILPGSLGTQRLPRLTGAAFALEAIQSGRMIGAREALEAGIVDELAEGPPLEVGMAYVQALLEREATPRRSSEQRSPRRVPDGFFEAARERAAPLQAAYPSARAIVEAVEAAVTQPFEQGEKVERKLLMDLVSSPQSAALRHLFVAERAAAKIPDLKQSSVRTIASVGVVGAGTMGGGIAMALVSAGLSVTLVEQREDALQAGLQRIRANYDASVARGKLEASKVPALMKRIVGATAIDAVGDCDLVIEAVFEDLEVKKRVCADLGRIARPGAILATNTSTLDVDILAEASGRPSDFLGLHFFSPANVMRLLEVVRGRATAPDVLATAMQLARTIRKVAVVSGVCYGFIGNRMAEPYLREADALLLEGATPTQIDRAVEDHRLWGMVMGPCRMLDMAGVDVAAKVLLERSRQGTLPSDPAYRAAVRRLHAEKRFGQKSGAGYYRYEGRKPMEDEQALRLFETLANELGVTRRRSIGDVEIVERLLYPMINEGMKILDEGIAYRASDIDVVWTAGYGFPDHRGGPMFMADRIGLRQIVDRLQAHGSERGDHLGYWTVSPLLARHAAEGRRITPQRVGA
jgi:3-hydroxyacyl-CoA dehydrogenase